MSICDRPRSSRVPAIVLVALMGCPLVASEIAPSAETVTFSVRARLEADPRAVAGHKAPAEDLTIAWRAATGSYVAAGEPLVGFSADALRRELQDMYLRGIVAELEMERTRLEKRERVDQLHDRAERLTADLAVVEARAARSAAPDRSELALAEARYRDAERRNAQAQQALERSLADHRLGQITTFELERRRLEAEQRARAAALAHRRWQQLRTDEARELAHRRDRLQRSELAAELGHPATADTPASGLYAEIETIEARTEDQIASAGHHIERRVRRFEESLPQAGDVTPLRRLRIWRGDRAVVDFSTLTDADAVDPAAIDHAGWSIPSRNEAPWWAQTWEPAALTVCGPARWSCDLPAGDYRLEVVIGGSRTWRGSCLTVADEQVFLAEELAAETQTIEHQLQHPGGSLHIDFNGPFDRTLRATAGGLADHNRWIDVGDVVRWTHHDIAFTKDPNRLRLRAHVHQDLVPFLNAGRETVASDAEEAGEAALAAIREAMTLSEVEIVSDGQVVGRAQIRSIGDRAVPLHFTAERRNWWSDEERHLIELGREVVLAPLDNWSPGRLRGHVTLVASCAAPPTATLLPPHLVRATATGHYVQPRGRSEPVRIQAFRLGDRYVAVDLAYTPDQLQAEIADPEADQAGRRRYPGTVVTGASVPAVMGDAWGRVVELLPDGSEVERGERILSVVDPWLESQQEELASAQEQVRRRALAAAEQRRLDAIRREREHRRLLDDAEDARVAIAQARRVDQLAIAQARSDREQALRAAEVAAAEAAAQADYGENPAALRAARRRADLAAIDLRRAELEAVAAQRGPGLIAIMQAEARLRDILDELAQRENDLRLAEVRDRVEESQAAAREERANWLMRRQRRFEEHRHLDAPAAGQLVYRQAYSQQSGRYDLIDEGSYVWRGLTVADIIDLERLAFVAELPENQYAEVAVGDQVLLRFPQLTADPIAAEISEVGRRLSVPDEDALVAESLTASRRLFTVRVAMTVPPDLVGRLVPGSKGEVILP